MTNSLDYYNESAEAFFTATVTVDMEPVYFASIGFILPACQEVFLLLRGQ